MNLSSILSRNAVIKYPNYDDLTIQMASRPLQIYFNVHLAPITIFR